MVARAQTQRQAGGKRDAQRDYKKIEKSRRLLEETKERTERMEMRGGRSKADGELI